MVAGADDAKLPRNALLFFIEKFDNNQSRKKAKKRMQRRFSLAASRVGFKGFFMLGVFPHASRRTLFLTSTILGQPSGPTLNISGVWGGSREGGGSNLSSYPEITCVYGRLLRQDRIYPHPLGDQTSDHGLRPWFEVSCLSKDIQNREIRLAWVFGLRYGDPKG